MPEEDSGNGAAPERLTWPEELELPALLAAENVRSLHETIHSEWGSLLRSACQTAAGRALWKQVIRDPLAEVLAGESYLRSLHDKIRSDQLNRAREVSGVIIAVRTLWFDSRLENAVGAFAGGEAQVVLLGAGMDTRAYRLGCLSRSSVFEVDFPELLETKEALLREALGSAEEQGAAVMARSLIRVAADIGESEWLEKLQRSGFAPEKNTVWLLEGILYYLSHQAAVQLLQSIADNCSSTRSVLLADFMNESCVSLSHSTFKFHCDWPDHLLPTLGFSQVKLSQIGDPDAHFGLMHDPENLFNRLRNLPRSMQTHPDDGTPCRRLYLVEASGSAQEGTR
ncbi:unnamed protein product [Spirodela intermedia]|uniref:Uncharacterized protein n=1 Tax=Spirodela intermedia TaxID=51605 RepID=A0A7I8K853_SPIIN|nr:unnamed protein product [Spirodela intermedia]